MYILYDRYLLISGQDIPLISNKTILYFFNNNENEYIEMLKVGDSEWPVLDRVTNYYPNLNKGEISKIESYLYHFKSILFRQYSTWFPRKNNYEFYGGACWTNFTHLCVKKFLNI